MSTALGSAGDVRVALQLLDSRSWLEVWHRGEVLDRIELHRPRRVPSAGYVDKPDVVRDLGLAKAVRVMLAGTGYDADAAIHELEARLA